MLKRGQDGRPKFPIFCKNRAKNLAIAVFGPRCLLETIKSLRETPKRLPRAHQGLQEAPKRRVNPTCFSSSPRYNGDMLKCINLFYPDSVSRRRRVHALHATFSMSQVGRIWLPDPCHVQPKNGRVISVQGC